MIEIKSMVKCFNGKLIRFSHLSRTTHCEMTCAVYLPPSPSPVSLNPPISFEEGRNLPPLPSSSLPNPNPNSNSTNNSNHKFPALMYLSGLTCTDENVCQKSGIFQHLSRYGIAFIAPDTSPRKVDIVGDSDSWDFGKGAGFYLNAIQEPWSRNYQMYSYLIDELPQIIESNFPSINMTKLSVTGHSMGGHGALVLAIKNQNLFQSVSAFSPICNPMSCPWGVKAFTNYLGPRETHESHWKEYDSCELLQTNGPTKYENILIDVGLADGFLDTQLQPSKLVSIASTIGQTVTYREHEGYDHSYYFVSTFLEDHVRFHAKYLL